MAEFKDRLKEAMSVKRINQTRLTEQANLAGGAVSNYLKGRYKPSSDSMIKIAEVLGVDVAWLSGNDERSKKINSVETLAIEYNSLDQPVEILVTNEERELLYAFRAATDHEQSIVKVTLHLAEVNEHE